MSQRKQIFDQATDETLYTPPGFERRRHMERPAMVLEFGDQTNEPQYGCVTVALMLTGFVSGILLGMWLCVLGGAM